MRSYSGRVIQQILNYISSERRSDLAAKVETKGEHNFFFSSTGKIFFFRQKRKIKQQAFAGLDLPGEEFLFRGLSPFFTALILEVFNSNFLPKDPGDLCRLPLICQTKAKILFQGAHVSVGVQIEPQIKVNSVSSMLRSALEGLGVAVRVPLWRIGELDKTQDLIRVLPDWELLKSKVWLLKHPGKTAAPLEKFVLFVKDVFSKETKVNHQALKTPSVT